MYRKRLNNSSFSTQKAECVSVCVCERERERELYTVEMAEKQPRAKVLLPFPSTRPELTKVYMQQHLRAQTTSPKAGRRKPKPKRKAPVAIPKRRAAQQIFLEPEYAELRVVRREPENHYASLLTTTREKSGRSSSDPNIPSSFAEKEKTTEKLSSSELELHYSNVHTAPLESYEEYSEGKGGSFCSYCKLITALATVIGVVLLVGLALGIAVASLSGNSQNAERYRKLEDTTQQMAEMIADLETQLNSSLSAVRSETDDLFVHQQGFHSNTSRLEQNIQQLNRSVQAEIAARQSQRLFTNSAIDHLNTDVEQLRSSLQRMNELTLTMNTSISLLTRYTVPIGCTSTIHENVTFNSSVAFSPKLMIQVSLFHEFADFPYSIA